jgi:hypothetical protein
MVWVYTWRYVATFQVCSAQFRNLHSGRVARGRKRCWYVKGAGPVRGVCTCSSHGRLCIAGRRQRQHQTDGIVTPPTACCNEIPVNFDQVYCAVTTCAAPTKEGGVDGGGHEGSTPCVSSRIKRLEEAQPAHVRIGCNLSPAANEKGDYAVTASRRPTGVEVVDGGVMGGPRPASSSRIKRLEDAQSARFRIGIGCKLCSASNEKGPLCRDSVGAPPQEGEGWMEGVMRGPRHASAAAASGVGRAICAFIF